MSPGDGPGLPFDREFLLKAEVAGRITVTVEGRQLPAHPALQEVPAAGRVRGDLAESERGQRLGHRLRRRLITGGKPVASPARNHDAICATHAEHRTAPALIRTAGSLGLPLMTPITRPGSLTGSRA